MERLFKIFLLFILSRRINAKMEGFIVNGQKAAITEFPHSAHLGVSCGAPGSGRGWMCGASIVNQLILLTAAHCLVGCGNLKTTIAVTVGNENKYAKTNYTMRKYIVHRNYSLTRQTLDIGLILLRAPLKLGSKVSRVILMKNPPYSKKGVVAGWGMVNETTKEFEPLLKYTVQTIMSRDTCLRYLNVPTGVICAGVRKDVGYASWGDSGSALVVHKAFQVGLVSHKSPSESARLVVYTDTAYYFDWIQDKSRILYCGS